ncbi:MAG: type I 3-dehydroquinate dehydratase [Planctomycetota bacterium]|nr:type I 3-dehydroquinate dehydratase [Planctomycetota bacterium]
MICISVTPTSRQLAKVDLLNASRQGDLIEVCLDHLAKEPDIADMISGISKPILISCRRPVDGGAWKGTEDQRMQLLRQAIIAGPEYIELDLDIADKIPRFGSVKRVVSYTCLDHALGNVDTVFDRAKDAKADVVKFTWPTPNLESAWPLLAAVTKKRDLPVVGLGMDRAGLTFSLLGQKFGSPWVYAALEQGMEAHPGQATVWELNDTYSLSEINPQTRFIGVVGMGDVERSIVKSLNAAFRITELNVRCLPIQLQKSDKLGKMLDILKINGLIVTPQAGVYLGGLASKLEDVARNSGFVDLLLRKNEEWNGYNTLWRCCLKSLEKTIGVSKAGEHPLDRRNVLLIGSDNMVTALAYGIQARKGVLSVASPNDDDARQTAQMFKVRHVPWSNLYNTMCDVAVVTDPSVKVGSDNTQLSVSYLRPGMTVMDIGNLPGDTKLLEEARGRDCKVVNPSDVFAEQVAGYFKSITGKDMPPEAISPE